MDQPPVVDFTAFADAWPRAIETEIAALCAIGRGNGLFDFYPELLEMSNNVLSSFQSYNLPFYKNCL